MNPECTNKKLQEILDSLPVTSLKTIEDYIQYNLKRVTALNSLLEIEDDVSNLLYGKTESLTRNILHICTVAVTSRDPPLIMGTPGSGKTTMVTPSDTVYFAVRDLSKQQTECALGTIPILDSPLLEVLKPNRKVLFTNRLLGLLSDTLQDIIRSSHPPFPQNFPLVKNILESPLLLERFRNQGLHHLTAIITWAILNDPSYLKSVMAYDFKRSYVEINKNVIHYRQKEDLSFAFTTIENYLAEKSIDRTLFLELTEELPYLPTLDLLEIIGKN